MILLYRLLTYLLLPFVVFFALVGTFLLLVALSNPALLLGVFMVVAFVIYYFTSFRFLHRGILPNQLLKPKLRDWIRVNAFVTMPFAVLNFMQLFTIIRTPALLDELAKQMVDLQQRMNLPPQPVGEYHKMLLTFLYVFLIFSLVLLVHVMLSFSFMKKYRHLFTPSSSS